MGGAAGWRGRQEIVQTSRRSVSCGVRRVYTARVFHTIAGSQLVERDGSVSGEAPPQPSAFTQSHVDASKAPHEFTAYDFESTSRANIEALARGCLRAWGLDAPANDAVLDQTGFPTDRIIPMLNSFGIARLPPTPPPGAGAMRSPVVTDVTEVLAVLLFSQKLPEVILPRPRVFHKPLPHIQHPGIDLVGYTRSGSGETKVFVVEVMATDSPLHPPDVVRQKRTQLLGETLGDENATRLMREFAWLHAESTNGDREVLNGLIIALQLRTLGTACSVVAVPFLVSKSGLFDPADWGPFLDSPEAFERAHIPSKVSFIAVCPRCDPLELVKSVKDVAAGSPTRPGPTRA